MGAHLRILRMGETNFLMLYSEFCIIFPLLQNEYMCVCVCVCVCVCIVKTKIYQEEN